MSEESLVSENNINNDGVINGNKKKNPKDKLVYIAMVLLVVWAIFHFKNKNGGVETSEADQLKTNTNSNNNAPAVANVESSNSSPEAKEVVIATAYKPVADVYTNNKSYNDNVFRVAFKGEFAQANLIIKAKTESATDNFLSLNVGTFSGLYQKDGQNVKLNKDNSLDLSLDLKNAEDFNKSQDVVLWNHLEPAVSKDNATLARMYAITIDQNGKYADNVEITEFKITYKCSENDPTCEISLCGAEVATGGQCLTEKFGADAAKNYIEYYSKK